MIIQTVCGFGVGTSLMLKINIENLLKKNNLEATVICSDVSSFASNECDIIFCSAELADTIEARANVPIVKINNFMDEKELTDKLIENLKEK